MKVVRNLNRKERKIKILPLRLFGILEIKFNFKS
jgi:hypothetical protein